MKPIDTTEGVTLTGGVCAPTYSTHQLGAALIESGNPHNYRLMKKLDGKTVLQGAYSWQQGLNGGFEWKDVPTVKETK